MKKRAVREKEDIHAFSFCQRNVTHCTPLLFSSLLIVNQNFDLNNMRTKSKILLFTCLTKILDRAVHQFVQNVSVVFCGVLHLCERFFCGKVSAEVASVRRHVSCATGVRKCEKQLCGHQGQRRRRKRRCSRHQTRDSLVVCGEGHGDTVCSLKPMEYHREADLHPAVHAVHPGCVRWTCCEGAAACGEPNQTRFLARAVACGVCTLEQCSPKGLHTQKGPTLELLKNRNPWEGLALEKSMGQGKSVRERSGR